MAGLFEEIDINGMVLRNRIVRSATWEGMCLEDGSPTARLTQCYTELAHGGVGLIITGYAYVRRDGRQLTGQMGIDCDEMAGAYKKLTRAVHEAGGVIAIQLVHAGGQTDSVNAGSTPLAPSSIEAAQYPEIPAELTTAEIADIIKAFGDSARRARAWGFDGVQLHGAHGYLINQFLSPHTNRRRDRYGGDIKNRSRFLTETYEEVRRVVGGDYPVMIKLTGSDNMTGGLTKEEALYAARRLSALGIDAIEVSSGTTASGDMNPAREQIDATSKEAYNLGLARSLKGAVDDRVRVMSVGGFRTYEICEGAVEDGSVDLVSLSRPLIWEPDLPTRWKSGQKNPALCISCNGCYLPGIKEGGIYCVVKKRWEGRG